VDELGIAQSKISQSAQQIVDRAVAEFRRRGHAVLTNDHIFFAFAQLEWSSFSGAMRGLTVTPRRDGPAGARHFMSCQNRRKPRRCQARTVAGCVATATPTADDRQW